VSGPTPGPWTINEWSGDFQIGPGAELVCEVPKGHGSQRLEAEANARLIAAAPDLLEACKRIAVDGFGVPIGDLEFLRAAIAKAEGQR